MLVPGVVECAKSNRKKRMATIHVVDASSLAHIAYHRYRYDIGEVTPALAERIAVGLVQEIAHPKQDDLVCVVLDTAPYWRCDVFPDYKAGRPPAPEGLYLFKEGMRNQKRFPVWGLDGFEADDCAAAIVGIFRDRKTDRFEHVVMYTTDQDWIGLVDPGVSWRGIGNNKFRTVTLDSFPDYFRRLYSKAKRQHQYFPCPDEPKPSDLYKAKALVFGDKSDNVIVSGLLYEEREALLPLVDLRNPMRSIDRADAIAFLGRALAA